jgi:hypothetical protein
MYVHTCLLRRHIDTVFQGLRKRVLPIQTIHIHIHDYKYVYIHTYLLRKQPLLACHSYTHTHTITHTCTHMHIYLLSKHIGDLSGPAQVRPLLACHPYTHTYIHIKLIAFELAAKFSRRRENPVQPRLCNAETQFSNGSKRGFPFGRDLRRPTQTQSALHTCIYLLSKYIDEVFQGLRERVLCLHAIHIHIHTYTHMHIPAQQVH